MVCLMANKHLIYSKYIVLTSNAFLFISWAVTAVSELKDFIDHRTQTVKHEFTLKLCP